MLTLFRRLVPANTTRAIRIDLAIFGAFVVVALVLLTTTTVSALRISSDIDTAITPQVAGIGKDTVLLPALDRTTDLTGRIAEAAAPLEGDLTGIARSNGEIAASLVVIDDHVGPIGDSIRSIKASSGGIRTEIADLAPVVEAIKSQTGDISDILRTVRTSTEAVAGTVTDIEALVGRTLTAAGRIDGSLGDIRTSIKSIQRHAENIENSKVLRTTNMVHLSDYLRP